MSRDNWISSRNGVRKISFNFHYDPYFFLMCLFLHFFPLSLRLEFTSKFVVTCPEIREYQADIEYIRFRLIFMMQIGRVISGCPNYAISFIIYYVLLIVNTCVTIMCIMNMHITTELCIIEVLNISCYIPRT